MLIEDGKVVSFHYDLSDESGEFLESSRDNDAVAYLHGKANIIHGLEAAMLGKTEGDDYSVTIGPTEGYGERHADAVQRIPLKHLNLKKKERALPGMVVTLDTEQGPRQVTVIKAGKFSVDVDNNHPFAGRTLVFKVNVVSVRDATEEELTHGHAHGVGGHHH